jgi:D-arabinose 1-dehydrogenase-like Zn-dependent alcohol dehydrogenase
MEADDQSKGASFVPILPLADNEYREFAWGKQKYGQKFEPMWINRGKVTGDYDVKIDSQYCGVCHSDLHLVENHLHETMYPIVPGHEIAGIVAEIGPKVTKFKIGDNVGVGVSVDSCLECEMCKSGQEQYCVNGKSVHTYNDKKRYGHIPGNP